MRQINFDILFRLRLFPAILTQWEFSKSHDMLVGNGEVFDCFRWSLFFNMMFSSKSVYLHLENSLVGSHNKWFRKAKLSLKD